VHGLAPPSVLVSARYSVAKRAEVHPTVNRPALKAAQAGYFELQSPVRHHLIENAFARLKHYRAVAFRYGKLKRNYESMVAMACGFLWLGYSM
jgi:transposase